MMDELTKLFNNAAHVKQSLEFTLSWNKISDWNLFIYHEQTSTTIFEGDDYSINRLAASGYVALTNWLDEWEDTENIEMNM